MAFFSPLLKTSIISLFIISTLLFFLLKSPNYPSPSPSIPHRSLITTSTTSCPSPTTTTTTLNNALINYSYIHKCIFNDNITLSLLTFSLFILFFFYILIKTAQSYFSVITTKLSSLLNLTPSIGAITLLALGNGAPDVFSSVAAVRNGNYRTGFGAILSAGTFVSAVVVGFVAIYAAPFWLDPAPFVRDVLFYMIAALFLFWVYLSGEIFLWQAVGFVGFYLFFVGVVFWMDLGMNGGRGRSGKGDDIGLVEKNEVDIGGGIGKAEKETESFGISRAFEKIFRVWEVPVSLVLKLTIPQTSPSEWSRFYSSANIVLCPLALLYACNSFMPFDHPIVFLLPHKHFPLWGVVLFASSSLALLHFIMEKKPPRDEQIPVILVGFVMSVFWISTVAGELLSCLAAVGELLELPPAILGLTVLAWGNSVGDLVADVAVAKAGQPAMAMAGCFAGPMFNMLVGLGTALVIQTADNYPKAYELHFHIGIIIAFVFLLLSLMGSLLVITWHRFRVPRFWGFCLVGLYAIFMAVSLVIARFSR